MSINSFHGKNRWLSNFWPCTVEFEGQRYSSTEAAYVASKTIDLEERKKIQAMSKPGDVKRFGRTLELRSDWEQIKVSVMLELLRQKFTTGTILGNRLIATGEQELIEGNTWGDTFWGVCKGRGLNTLGNLLMQVRDEIKESQYER